MKTLIEGPGRMRYHTHLRPLFGALGERLTSLRWLVTAYDCNEYPGPFPFDPEVGPRLVDGGELRRLAEDHDPQFIWAVFSGFDPRTPIDVERLTVEPWADGNPAVWDASGGPQHPGAMIEIVCFDAGTTVVTSDDPEVHRLLCAHFPEAKPMP